MGAPGPSHLGTWDSTHLNHPAPIKHERGCLILATSLFFVARVGNHKPRDIHSRLSFFPGHEFTRADKSPKRRAGFTGCGKTRLMGTKCQGTTSVVPIRAIKMQGFNPCGGLFGNFTPLNEFLRSLLRPCGVDCGQIASFNEFFRRLPRPAVLKRFPGFHRRR